MHVHEVEQEEVHVDEDQEEEVVVEVEEHVVEVEEHVEEVRHLLIEAKEPNESEGLEQLVSEVGEVVTSDLAPRPPRLAEP